MNNGSQYRYYGAGKHFRAMASAKSAGNYLNEEVKTQYECVKKGGV